MKISYIIPHRNRVKLLEYNLKSLLNQTYKNIEIVIIDNSDDLSYNDLKIAVGTYRDLGLDIVVSRVDPSKHPMAHPKTQYGGGYNPALSQNIGARKSSGDIVVLTSPEVVNAKTNCQNISDIFTSSPESMFVLGWVDELPESTIKIMMDDFDINQMKYACRNTDNKHGAMCRDDVPRRPWQPQNYFIGCLKRHDYIRIGGVDERFMESMAYEDDFFARCCKLNGFPAQFNADIAGIHIEHSRSYQAATPKSNKGLWERLRDSNISIANSGFDFGSFKYITEEF